MKIYMDETKGRSTSNVMKRKAFEYCQQKR